MVFNPLEGGRWGLYPTAKATFQSDSKQSFLIGYELVKWIFNTLSGSLWTNYEGRGKRPWAKLQAKKAQ